MAQRVGIHVLADIHGVDSIRLQDESWIMSTLRQALKQEGFHVRGSLSHHYETGGCGVTAVFLLEESHLAFHSYPEHSFAAVDVFSCGSEDPAQLLDLIKNALNAAKLVVFQTTRGDCESQFNGEWHACPTTFSRAR